MSARIIASADRSGSNVARLRRQGDRHCGFDERFCIVLAVAAGLAIAAADSSPGWDSTGITAGLLLVAAARLPRRGPARLAVGACSSVPLVPLMVIRPCGQSECPGPADPLRARRRRVGKWLAKWPEPLAWLSGAFAPRMTRGARVLGQVGPPEPDPEVVARMAELRARQEQDALGLDELGGPVVDPDPGNGEPREPDRAGARADPANRSAQSSKKPSRRSRLRRDDRPRPSQHPVTRPQRDDRRGSPTAPTSRSSCSP